MGPARNAKQKICREQYLSYKVTLKSMRPASIQVPCPIHGIEPVERLGTDIGKKTTKKAFFNIDQRTQPVPL